MLDLPPVAKDPQDLPGVIDDSKGELTGTWERSTNFRPHVGNGYIHDNRLGDGQSQAVFRFKAPESGEYELSMSYSAHETRATNVPVVVTSGAHEKRIVVDQTQPIPSDQHFRPVGKVQLEAGVETVIKVTNQETDGFVILDALRLLPAN